MLSALSNPTAHAAASTVAFLHPAYGHTPSSALAPRGLDHRVATPLSPPTPSARALSGPITLASGHRFPFRPFVSDRTRTRPFPERDRNPRHN